MRRHVDTARFRIWILILGVWILTGCISKAPLLEEFPAEALREVQKVPYRIVEGEHLTFSIRWLGFEFGTGEIKLEGIETIQDREAYHVSMRVWSNALIDLVYPVRDEHHSYIDVEHFHSLRYEKVLREGRYRADEVMVYDQDQHTAVYESRLNGTKKQMMIPEHVQDQLSCAFWLRYQAMKPGDHVHIPVDADEQNWDVEIHVVYSDRKKIGDLGTFDALRIDPSANFQGVFIRRGKFWGWMSMDDRRLPLLMQSKIPVLGSVNIVLVDYQPRLLEGSAVEAVA